jgi:hypothetical protein
MGEPDDIGLDPMPEMGEEPVLSSALSLGESLFESRVGT